jgi:hypothetical protein
MANKYQKRDNDYEIMRCTIKEFLNLNKQGHLAKDCWYKDSNKDKLPKQIKMIPIRLRTVCRRQSAQTNMIVKSSKRLNSV